MPLKTILFDLGNVLLDFSHERMCEQIAAIFDVSTEVVREALFGNRYLQQFDRGMVSEDEVHEYLEAQFSRRCEPDQLRRAVGDIFTLNTEMLEIVQLLKRQNFRLVILSNTCVTHIEWIRTHHPLLDLFDDLVLSYEVGACKPEAAIFAAALKTIQCAPEDCFYTDDILNYVETARHHGLQAEQFSGAQAFRQQLATRGVIL